MAQSNFLHNKVVDSEVPAGSKILQIFFSQTTSILWQLGNSESLLSNSWSLLWGAYDVGSLKLLLLSFAKEPYKKDYILQKRPTILRSLLIVATP